MTSPNTPARRTMDFSDGAISYLEWEAAAGVPTLVFAHANGFNAQTYRTLLQPLAGQLRVVAFDMRGHGFTTLPADPALIRGWRVYRDDLIRFAERLGGEPKIFAGHSLGATTSLMAAAARPDLSRALLLIEPVLPPTRTVALAAFARIVRREDSLLPRVAPARRRRARFASHAEAVAAFRSRGAFKTWPEAMLADYVEGGLLKDEAGGFRLACAPSWEAANFAVFPFGLASLGARIRVPLTILCGTVHSAANEAVLQGLVRRHRDTRVEHVEGASHFLPMERPERVREEILRCAAA